jgi:dGTPase
VDLANNNWKENNLSGVSKKLIRLGELNFSNATDLYSCTKVITDFVSGMTDRYASDLFKKLSGNL